MAPEMGGNGSRPQDGEAKRPRMSPEDRARRNQELIRHPNSVVIVPKTIETRALTSMLYPLNRALARLRVSAGMRIPVSTVMHYLTRLSDWQESIVGLLQRFGVSLDVDGSLFLSDRMQHEAGLPNCFVIVAQTEEIRKLGQVIIALDKLLVRVRMTSPDLTQNESFFKDVETLVMNLHNLCEEMCKETGVRYLEPRAVRRTDGSKPMVHAPSVSRT